MKRYVNVFTLSLAAWIVILSLVVMCRAVAGTRYEGADSTDGRYWERTDKGEIRLILGYVNKDGSVTYPEPPQSYRPRPEAWEMVRVDTVGWYGCPDDSGLLSVTNPLLDTIYAPKYLLLEGPDGPTWITGAERDRLLSFLSLVSFGGLGSDSIPAPKLWIDDTLEWRALPPRPVPDTSGWKLSTDSREG